MAPVLLALLLLTAGATVGMSRPAEAPVAPNDSLVTAEVLGYCMLDSSLLGITPKYVLYGLTLLVVESADIADMANFTKPQVGKVIRTYSREPVDANVFLATIQARVRFAGDERGGTFWIREIQVLRPAPSETTGL